MVLFYIEVNSDLFLESYILYKLFNNLWRSPGFQVLIHLTNIKSTRYILSYCFSCVQVVINGLYSSENNVQASFDSPVKVKCILVNFLFCSILALICFFQTVLSFSHQPCETRMALFSVSAFSTKKNKSNQKRSAHCWYLLTCGTS